MIRAIPSIVACLSLFLSTNSVPAADPTFKAGAFAQDVTPTKFPISVNGGFQDRLAKAVHDRLHARCLVLDDGKTKIALVVVDSCMMPRDLLDKAKTAASKKTGIPFGNILVSATHTHTAPTAASVFQSDPDPEYVAFLSDKIAEGIEKAHARLAPAKIGWGVGSDPTQVFNRRWFMKSEAATLNPFGKHDGVRMNPGYQNPDLEKPAGPIDPDISILSVVRADGKPLALYANYSLHYVGGVDPISADYYGAYAEKIASLLDADKEFVGIMSNGTSGNINNVNFAGAAPKGQKQYEQIRIVADSVAKATFEAWKKIEHHDHAELAAATAEIELGVRKPTKEDVAYAKEIIGKAKDKIMRTAPEVYARETLKMAEYPDTVRGILQAIRIGDVGIAAIPCEVFVEIGKEIKAKSPHRTSFTVSLANGYNGYLPTPEHHRLGGYETWRAQSSYLETEASSKITAKLLDLVKQVAK